MGSRNKGSKMRKRMLRTLVKGDPRVMVYQTFKATRTEGARTLFQKQKINIGSDISIHFKEGVTWGVCCFVIYKYIKM